MKEKIIFHGFILIIFLVSLMRIINNITYSKENNMGKGVIYDSDSYKRSGNSARVYTYYIVDKNGKKYEDGGSSDTVEYGFLIGDTVTFRKLHNGDSKSVRMIKRNGEQIRNYYGFVDYASVICIILIILGYIFIPKLLKT
jgi:hypothetical protein